MKFRSSSAPSGSQIFRSATNAHRYFYFWQGRFRTLTTDINDFLFDLGALASMLNHVFSARVAQAFLTSLGLAAGALTSNAFAELPTGFDAGQSTGVGSVVDIGNTQNITTVLQNSVGSFATFNIGAQNVVNVLQPNSASAFLAVVRNVGAPSQIFGALNSNGSVGITNASGVFVGASGVINTAGFLATTASVSQSKFLNGQGFDLTLDPNNQASVINQGTINVGGNGFVVLAAKTVENSGTINGGKVALISAQKTLIATDGTTLHLSASNPALPGESAFSGIVNNTGRISANTLVEGPNGEITLLAVGGESSNSGELVANGGSVDVLGQTVNVAGTVDVSSANGGGSIRVGGDFRGENPAILNSQSTTVSGKLLASATDAGNSGNVTVWSDGDTSFTGQIEAKGGAGSGNGGRVEVSGKENLGFDGIVDTSAANGTVGSLLLDPTNAIVTTPGGAAAGDVPANTPGANFFINAASLSASTADITIEATNNVTVAADVNRAAGGDTTFNAGNQFKINAGRTFSALDNVTVNANKISIDGALTSTAGDLTLTAGNVTVNADKSLTLNDFSLLSANAANTFNVNAAITADSGNVTLNSAGRLLVTTGGSVNTPAGTLNATSYTRIAAISDNAAGEFTGSTVNLKAPEIGGGGFGDGSLNVAAGTLTLNADNANVEGIGTVNLGTSTVNNTLNLSSTADLNIDGTLNADIVTLNSGANLGIAAPIIANTEANLTAVGDIQDNNFSGPADISAPTLRLTSTGGDIGVSGVFDTVEVDTDTLFIKADGDAKVAEFPGATGFNLGASTAGGLLEVTTQGSLTVTGLVKAQDVSLISGDDLILANRVIADSATGTASLGAVNDIVDQFPSVLFSQPDVAGHRVELTSLNGSVGASPGFPSQEIEVIADEVQLSATNGFAAIYNTSTNPLTLESSEASSLLSVKTRGNLVSSGLGSFDAKANTVYLQSDSGDLGTALTPIRTQAGELGLLAGGSAFINEADGVNLLDLKAGTDLTVTTNGATTLLTGKTAQATTGNLLLDVKGANTLTNRGAIVAGEDVRLNAQTINNRGSVEAERNVYTLGNNLVNFGGATLTANTGDVEIRAFDKINNFGQAEAGRDVRLSGNNGVTNGGVLDAGRTVRLTSSAGFIDLKPASQVSGDRSVIANALKDIKVDGSVLSELGSITFNAGQKLDFGTRLATSSLEAAKNITLTSGGRTQLDGSVLSTTGDINATAGNNLFIGTTGLLSTTTGDINLVAVDNLINRGQISAGNIARLNADAITNRGSVKAERNIYTLSKSLVNFGGATLTATTGDVEIRAYDQVNNFGTINAKRDVRISANDGMTNGGLLKAGRTVLLKSLNGFIDLRPTSQVSGAISVIANALKDIKVDGSVFSKFGSINLNAGKKLDFGTRLATSSLEAAQNINLTSGGRTQLDGSVLSQAGNINVASQSNLFVGTTGSLTTQTGNIALLANNDNAGAGNLTVRGTVNSANDLRLQGVGVYLPGNLTASEVVFVKTGFGATAPGGELLQTGTLQGRRLSLNLAGAGSDATGTFAGGGQLLNADFRRIDGLSTGDVVYKDFDGFFIDNLTVNGTFAGVAFGSGLTANNNSLEGQLVQSLGRTLSATNIGLLSEAGGGILNQGANIQGALESQGLLVIDVRKPGSLINIAPSGSLTTANGGIIGLRADSLNLGGPINAGSNGSIYLVPTTGNSPITLGVTGAPALFDLNQSEFNNLTAGDIWIGYSPFEPETLPASLKTLASVISPASGQTTSGNIVIGRVGLSEKPATNLTLNTTGNVTEETPEDDAFANLLLGEGSNLFLTGGASTAANRFSTTVPGIGTVGSNLTELGDLNVTLSEGGSIFVSRLGALFNDTAFNDPINNLFINVPPEIFLPFSLFFSGDPENLNKSLSGVVDGPESTQIVNDINGNNIDLDGSTVNPLGLTGGGVNVPGNPSL